MFHLPATHAGVFMITKACMGLRYQLSTLVHDHVYKPFLFALYWIVPHSSSLWAVKQDLLSLKENKQNPE